ncbi:hypothetical protein VTO42DRAFT_8248 [Malbranchea cinnamomea]
MEQCERHDEAELERAENPLDGLPSFVVESADGGRRPQLPPLSQVPISAPRGRAVMGFQPVNPPGHFARDSVAYQGYVPFNREQYTPLGPAIQVGHHGFAQSIQMPYGFPQAAHHYFPQGGHLFGAAHQVVQQDAGHGYLTLAPMNQPIQHHILNPAARHRTPDQDRDPDDAEVITISSTPTPPNGASQVSDQNAETMPSQGQAALPQQRVAPPAQSVESFQPSTGDQRHTTFKQIKIHTAKCDVCNRHNKSTLHRCTDCGWQICSPCWEKRGGNGEHGPERTFTGPVFRDSEFPEKNNITGNDSDETLSYVEDREDSKPPRPPTRGKGKGMGKPDHDGDVPMSGMDDEEHRRWEAATSLMELRYQNMGASQSQRQVFPGGNLDGSRQSHDVLPASQLDINDLILATRQALRQHENQMMAQDLPGQPLHANNHQASDGPIPNSPLFVPQETGYAAAIPGGQPHSQGSQANVSTHVIGNVNVNMPSRKPPAEPKPEKLWSANRINFLADHFTDLSKLGLAPERQYPHVEEFIPTSSSGTSTQTEASSSSATGSRRSSETSSADISSGSNTDPSTGSAIESHRSEKRPTTDPEHSQQLETPSESNNTVEGGSHDNCDNSNSEKMGVEFTAAERLRANPHGRAWEL